jgi:hypothetical protein
MTPAVQQGLNKYTSIYIQIYIYIHFVIFYVYMYVDDMLPFLLRYLNILFVVVA